MSHLSWRSAAVGAAGVLVMLGLAALLVIGTGSYNVAADERHECIAQ
ncbi:hypothetical protein [Rhizorhapis sp. SPR117]|nr:hypothetical protein [Rhizorhapis sp. SPR117]